MKKTFILGIETSCDETSVSIVKNGREVLSCEIATSIPLHQETKGVVPEVAARAQTEAMIPVLEKALKTANMTMEDIDLIAVTQGPGLIGSLLVGISCANSLSLAHNIPVMGVPHIWGHMYANLLDSDTEVEFPALVLTVSGGHNDLYIWKSHGEFQLLGHTLDDAAGEAFDKCGRLLDLDYPAGPKVSALALQGDRKAYDFPRSMKNKPGYNFSFSGIKTAFLYTLEKETLPLSDQTKQNLCASLEEAIAETLLIKVQKACKEFPEIQQIHLSGGVSANSHIRNMFTKNISLPLFFPENKKYCTDNAAMIAGAAYYIDRPTGFVSPQFDFS